MKKIKAIEFDKGFRLGLLIGLVIGFIPTVATIYLLIYN
jgi:hypothetical protein